MNYGRDGQDSLNSHFAVRLVYTFQLNCSKVKEKALNQFELALQLPRSGSTFTSQC